MQHVTHPRATHQEEEERVRGIHSSAIVEEDLGAAVVVGEMAGRRGGRGGGGWWSSEAGGKGVAMRLIRGGWGQGAGVGA